MGEVKRDLDRKILSGVSFFRDDLRIEVAELIHVHWRDVRILATPEQFRAFLDGMKAADKAWEGNLSPEQDVALSNSGIPGQVTFENIATIEEQENGCIHFHYQDIRIEMPVNRFLMLARLFEKAKMRYNKSRAVMLPMELINPYDGTHFKDRDEWIKWDNNDFEYHQEGIVKTVQGISCGIKIRPIVVIKQEGPIPYQRLDGFKRYMAYEYLNKREIPCYIYDEYLPGVQDGQTTFEEVL